MFCHKCGTQIAEGASFCHKCGTKVVCRVPMQQSEDMLSATNKSENIDTIGTVQKTTENTVDSFTSMNDGKEFIQFVDDHVRTTTEFQSAEDLIMNSKPWKFVWICFGLYYSPNKSVAA